MATRANIVAFCKDGNYRVIYLHWDGYPEHALKTLQEHYTDQDKVEKLMSLGDLSCIDASPECPEGHSFKTPVEGHCIAYGRDRGEDGVTARITGSKIEAKYACNESYVYVWDGESWAQGFKKD